MSHKVMADDWSSEACTLPTVDQPLRRAEFDDLFRQHVVTAVRTTTQALRLELRDGQEVAARAALLAVKETGCCSFFTFDLHISEGKAAMVISTDPAHGDIITALAERATSKVDGQT